MPPKVSVLIPIYNTERYLRECLDSVLRQTLEEIEIICINDGSTDSSLDILREYAQKDSRIRILDKPNTGYGDSMNRGINTASGEYIGIVESDDFVDPEMYEKTYAAAKRHHADAVFANTWDQNETTPHLRKQLPDSFDNTEIYQTTITGNDVYHYLREKQGIYHWSGIYKKDFLNRNHLRYNPTPGASYQDCGFFYTVLYCRPAIRLLNEAFYHYRTDNPESSVFSSSKVACIHDEFIFINEFIQKDPANKQFFSPAFSRAMSDCYFFNYVRLDKKYQYEFLNIMKRDLRLFFREGLFSFGSLCRIDRVRCGMIFLSPRMFHLGSLFWNFLRDLRQNNRERT